MRVAKLTVERANGERRYTLRVDPGGRALQATSGGNLKPGLTSITSQLKELEGTASAPGAERLESFVRRSADSLAHAIPGQLVSRLRDWASREPAPATLLVEGGAELPFELLTATVPNLLVARLRAAPAAPAAPKRAAPTPGPARLLVAGWPTALGTPPPGLPGIREELDGLARRAAPARLEVVTLADPTFAELKEALAETKPTVAHLSPPAMDDRGAGKLPMRGEGGVEWIDVPSLAVALHADDALRLVTLNVCYGGAGACGLLCDDLGVAAVGWAGGVEDRVAGEFALSLYDGLLAGLSVPEAVRHFCGLFGPDQMLARGMPVVWVPAEDRALDAVLAIATPAVRSFRTPAPAPRAASEPASAAEPEAPPPPAPAPASRSAAPALSPPPPLAAVPRRAEGPPRIGIDLTLQGTLFPSLIRNGVPAVELLWLSADRDAEVEVEVACDTGAGSSSYHATVALEARPGEREIRVPVHMKKVQFPVLYELMNGEGRRYVNFAVVVRQGDRVLARRTDSVLWRGRSEWLDQPEAWPYLASFVVPMCAGVLRVVEEARRVLRAIVGPKASFAGYNGSAEATDRQVEAVFQALRDPPLAIRYIAPPGSPLFSGAGPSGPDGERRADTQQIGQLVRLPDAVVEQRQGTCHDLALLVAAVLEYLTLRPLLVLVDGHTFCGYWRTAEAHEQFWTKAIADRARVHPGAKQVLTRAEVNAGLEKEELRLVEATRVSEADTFEEACQAGIGVFTDTCDGTGGGGRRWDAAVDVAASRRQLVEPV